MPHATSMPFSGFQAAILCGPGVSLNTFTANPEDFPKALVPIANRPMVWYPMDWCYRMGITNINLITPPASQKALEAALSQNPHLTSLPSPRADILAPAKLTHTTPTAEILRLPEVQAAITGDFLVLPCDLVTELPGESLLESWMVQQSGLGYQATGLTRKNTNLTKGRRGGLGVYFETRGADHVKGAETDFIITSSLSSPPAQPSDTSLRPHISKLLYATTTDTLRDITDEAKGLPIRHGLIRKHGKIRMLTTHRDAHIYLFPRWVMDWVQQNDKFDSISEDVVGWWAKSGWQDGLAEKLHLGTLPHTSSTSANADDETKDPTNSEDHIDLASMSSTHTSTLTSPLSTSYSPPPQILAYIHPTPTSSNPSLLLRRVDTSPLLLSTTLHIATLPPTHPLSHPTPTDPSATLAPHTTIHTPTTLIGPNTTIEKHCNIRTTVVGANCIIGAGVKLTGCLLMDGVVVNEKVELKGCILGRRCVVRRGVALVECEVQEGFEVPEGTEGKGEKFSAFEGLGDEGMGGEEEKGGWRTEEGM